MAATPLVRRSIRVISHNARLAQALQVTPPLWQRRDISSSASRRARNEPSDEFPGATIRLPSAAETSKTDFDAEMCKVEQSLAMSPIETPGRDDPSPAPAQADSPAAEPIPKPTPSWAKPPKLPKPTDQPHHSLPPLNRQPIKLPPIKPARPHNRARPHIAPGAREYLRFARIFNLATTTTLGDILGALAATAPVGRVLDIAWDRGGRARPFKGRDVRAAIVLFDHEAAVVDLMRLATQRRGVGAGGDGVQEGFCVCGERPFVSVWTQRAFNGNVDAPEFSRVLVMQGSQDVPGFSEEELRALLLGNEAVVKALGELGLETEQVVTTDSGMGQRKIEWRFFSNQKQARVVLPIMRRYFYKELRIDFGPDPCWNEKDYPRQRTSTRDVRHLAGLAEAKAPGSFCKRYLRDEDETSVPGKKTTRWAHGDEDEGPEVHYDLDLAQEDTVRKGDERFDPYLAHEDSVREEFQARWYAYTPRTRKGEAFGSQDWDDNDHDSPESLAHEDLSTDKSQIHWLTETHGMREGEVSGLQDWDNEPDFTPNDRGRNPSEPLEPINWDDIKYDPLGTFDTEDDENDWEEDPISFEDDRKDPTEEDPFKELLRSAHEQEKPKPKKPKPRAPLASSQKKRVSEWLRVQKIIADRHNYPTRE